MQVRTRHQSSVCWLIFIWFSYPLPPVGLSPGLWGLSPPERRLWGWLWSALGWMIDVFLTEQGNASTVMTKTNWEKKEYLAQALELEWPVQWVQDSGQPERNSCLWKQLFIFTAGWISQKNTGIFLKQMFIQGECVIAERTLHRPWLDIENTQYQARVLLLLKS